jgi:hypothetical protein
MKQIQRHLGTVTALVLLGILAAATIFSFTALKHRPQTAERTFQSVLPTPTTQVSATTTPNRPKKDSKDIVVTVVPPEIAPDVLTEPTIITKRSAPRSELAVDGNYVVWQSYEDGQSNVVAYHLQTGEERCISSLPGGKSSLRISDRYVVWAETLAVPDVYKRTIRVYDLISRKEMSVSSSGDYPDISDNRIVWNESRNPQEPLETGIYGYDLVRNVEFPVVVGPGRHLFPRISNDWVIYLNWLPGVGPGTPSPDQPTLHAHSIRTGEDIDLGPVAYRNDAWSYKRHVISGHMVAWQGPDGATHLYDLAARRERVLTELQSYDDLVLNGRFFTVGSQLYNVETGAKLAPLRAPQPVAFGPAAQVGAVTTDGQTLVWGFDIGNEGRIYVARFRRLP